LQALRENTLVTVANIASTLNLNTLEEPVIELYTHGLLHWSICRSNDAQDTLCTLSETSLLSPQRLALESLSKMTINDINVDLILSSVSNMQPYLETLINLLCTEWLVRRDDQTLREFSVVLITALAKCDPIASRLIAKHCSFLLAFIEDF
jgi:AT-rich interactive domain-containing protein 1